MNSQDNITSGAFVLTPAAGKRVIGKAVASLPEVQAAAKSGRMLIANGTTTSFVVEELTGEKVAWFPFCVGIVTEGKYVENPTAEKTLFYFEDGKVSKLPFKDFLETMRKFGPDDVFIKGANAVDPFGNAAGLQSNPNGGSWAEAFGICTARRFHTIIPVGLEKMIPSVIDAAEKLGQLRVKYCVGNPVGLIPLCSFEVITEIEAFELLTGVTAFCVSGGGVSGSEGARGFVVEGTEAEVKAALALAMEVAGQTLAPAGQVEWKGRLPEGL